MNLSADFARNLRHGIEDRGTRLREADERSGVCLSAASSRRAVSERFSGSDVDSAAGLLDTFLPARKVSKKKILKGSPFSDLAQSQVQASAYYSIPHAQIICKPVGLRAAEKTGQKDAPVFSNPVWRHKIAYHHKRLHLFGLPHKRGCKHPLITAFPTRRFIFERTVTFCKKSHKNF